MEMAVAKSGTLTLVEPFLVSHQPSVFSQHDYKHSQGRPKEWLTRLVPPSPSPAHPNSSSSGFFRCSPQQSVERQKACGFSGLDWSLF